MYVLYIQVVTFSVCNLLLVAVRLSAVELHGYCKRRARDRLSVTPEDFALASGKSRAMLYYLF